MRPSPRIALGVLAIAAGAFLLFRPSSRGAPRAPIAGTSPRPGMAPRPKAPSTPAPAPAPAPGTRPHAPEVARFSWGSGPDDLGRSTANESAPMGPSAFVVGKDGTVWVLDQVNARVLVVEGGKVVRRIPLPSDTFEDLAVLPGGRLALLDRLVTGSVAVVGTDGKIEREIALRGAHVPDAGDVTSMASEGDGLWAEVDHRGLVRVADVDGRPVADRTLAPGRFAADGRTFVRARVDEARQVVVTVTARDGSSAREAHVAFPLPVLALHGLATDAAGRTFVAAMTIDESPEPPFEVRDVLETVVVLDDRLAELSRIDVPAKSVPEEQLLRYRLGDDGFFYQLAFSEGGASLLRISP